MPYRKRPPARAKRNFRRVGRALVAKKRRFMPKQRFSNSDKGMKLKITTCGTFKKSDFFTASDGSMFINLLWNPTQNLSTTPTQSGDTFVCNPVYHNDCNVPTVLYNYYRHTCIVFEMTRPAIAINYGEGEVGPANQIRRQSVPFASEVLHSKVIYEPDAHTGSIQPTTTLTPKLNIQYPTSYNALVDNGTTGVQHGDKKSIKRVWKPTNAVEKRWSSKSGDRDLSIGGLHCRFKSHNAIDLSPDEGNQWHCQDQAVLLDWTAHIYMEYKGRV